MECEVRNQTMVKVSIIYSKNTYMFRLKDKRRKQIRFENISYICYSNLFVERKGVLIGNVSPPDVEYSKSQKWILKIPPSLKKSPLLGDPINLSTSTALYMLKGFCCVF